MVRLFRRVLPVAIMLLAGVAGASAEVEVMVSIGPQKWLIEQIGGDRVNCRVLVSPGRDPHTFEPSPRQVAAISRSTLWFTMEMEFEHHLEEKVKGIAPGLMVVDSTEGVTRRQMRDGHGHGAQAHEAKEGSHTDHHGDDDEHPAGFDPHVWLSPVNLELMAVNITNQLVQVDGEHASVYRQNLVSLLESLRKLDNEVKTKLAEYRGRSFFVFHPTFGYFADQYGLIQEPVEIEGKSPSPRQLSALAKRAREEGVNVIFVQPQFDQKSGSVLATAIGGKVVPVDALGENAAANITIMAEQLTKAFGQQRSGK